MQVNAPYVSLAEATLEQWFDGICRIEAPFNENFAFRPESMRQIAF